MPDQGNNFIARIGVLINGPNRLACNELDQYGTPNNAWRGFMGASDHGRGDTSRTGGKMEDRLSVLIGSRLLDRGYSK